ncbi:MAG: NADPH-dependent F420 reductase [Halanaeroarchaeum sp.]
MRVAILGGTGDIGQGLALRLCYDTGHEVVVGSRDGERARAKAEEYETELSSRGIDRSVVGVENERAAEDADVVLLAIPPEHVHDVVTAIGSGLPEDAIVVTPVVRMSRRDWGLRYDPPREGSMTAVVAQNVPQSNPVVGAFHSLSADRLANLDVTLDLDTMVIGDDTDAKGLVVDLVAEIEGLRPVDAGPLANAPAVESVTPLLITLGIHGAGHDLGVKFV